MEATASLVPPEPASIGVAFDFTVRLFALTDKTPPKLSVAVSWPSALLCIPRTEIFVEVRIYHVLGICCC